MTRIKKSFEQKEEFLKRPTLPYWVNSDVQSPPIPKEFYAQPQKFSRPLWPPSSSIDSQESLNLDPPKETTSKEIASKDASSKETAPKEIASKETTKTNQVLRPAIKYFRYFMINNKMISLPMKTASFH